MNPRAARKIPFKSPVGRQEGLVGNFWIGYPARGDSLPIEDTVGNQEDDIGLKFKRSFIPEEGLFWHDRGISS
jgi:hypothetical protein